MSQLNGTLRRAAIVCTLLACGLSAQADGLSGTVIDPQQSVVVGAEVTLDCGSQSETHKTNAQGVFTFTRQRFAASCKLRVLSPGFSSLEVPVSRRRVLTLQLQVAAVVQTVAVSTGRLSSTSLASASLSDEELRTISNESPDQISYAKQLAGIYSDLAQIYVDGMPADAPPPADRIGSVTINADPFSAEYSDGGNTHIDITTKKTERKFRITSLGLSLGSKAPDGLNSSLSSTSKSANIGIAGPVPYLPIAFTSNVNFSESNAEEPIEAVVPIIPGNPLTDVNSAALTGQHMLYGLGMDYAQKETLRVNAALYVATSRETNMNVGGMTLPEAGESQDSSAQEFRGSFTATGKHFVSRGGITASWFNADLNANSDQLGVSAQGAFVAGGAGIDKEKDEWSRWTLKDVFQFDPRDHLWSVGATLSRRSDVRNTIPNPHGQICFDNSANYVLSATTGANNGTGTLVEGQGKVEYTSYIAAPFIEGELLHRASVLVKAGLRADTQTSGGVHFSPRLSASASRHNFVVRAGSGMFVQPWTNDIFIRLIENDGYHLQQYLIPDVSLAGIASGTMVPETEIVASPLPNLTLARNWITKISVERPFKNFGSGVEYTWTDGTHLLGSQRLSSPTGWTDWLGSNRALQKHQIHLRALYKIGGESFTAHYEWIHSRDNTDGPFSFPAAQSDLRDEWGPSSGVAVQNLSLVANSKVGKVLVLTLVDSWHSALPLNITSGLDPAGNGLFTDRDGLARNSARGRDFNSAELLVHFRFAVPKLILKTANQRTYIDCNLQGLNFLNNKNDSSFETVIGSPIFMQPLAAAPGRSFRFSFSLSH